MAVCKAYCVKNKTLSSLQLLILRQNLEVVVVLVAVVESKVPPVSDFISELSCFSYACHRALDNDTYFVCDCHFS